VNNQPDRSSCQCYLLLQLLCGMFYLPFWLWLADPDSLLLSPR